MDGRKEGDAYSYNERNVEQEEEEENMEKRMK